MGKYTSKVEFHLGHAELVEAARRRGLTTYQELAKVCGLPTSGNVMGAETGQILGDIVDYEQ